MLSISFRSNGIIREYGGELKIHSEVGKGTTVKVFLPLIKDYSEKKLIHLRNDVRVTNEKDEKLRSEELFWDQAAQKIYTNKVVRITRDGETITGEGLESNENFTKYRILKPFG